MNASRVLLPFVLLYAANAAGETQVDTGDPSESGIELLRDGFHYPAYNWPTVESGEKWWGLYRMSDGTFSMMETNITVSEKHEGCIGEDQPYVSLDKENECLFLVRGSSHFKEGPVVTVYEQKTAAALLQDCRTKVSYGRLPGQLLPGEDIRVYQFDGFIDIIFALGNVEEYQIISRHSLNIVDYKDWRTRHIYQTLFTVDRTGVFMTLPEILWIGDLDHDGRLDLLVDARPYPGNLWVLFLSTEAKEEEIVGKAAELQTPGC